MNEVSNGQRHKGNVLVNILDIFLLTLGGLLGFLLLAMYCRWEVSAWNVRGLIGMISIGCIIYFCLRHGTIITKAGLITRKSEPRLFWFSVILFCFIFVFSAFLFFIK